MREADCPSFHDHMEQRSGCCQQFTARREQALINITEDRLRWLVLEQKHLTLDGAVEIAKAAPDLLAEIERLSGMYQISNTENDELRTENERLRTALKPFADLMDTRCNGYESSPDDEIVRSVGTFGRDYCHITVGDLRRAVAALGNQQATQSGDTVECQTCGASVKFGGCCEKCRTPTDH